MNRQRGSRDEDAEDCDDSEALIVSDLLQERCLRQIGRFVVGQCCRAGKGMTWLSRND